MEGEKKKKGRPSKWAEGELERLVLECIDYITGNGMYLVPVTNADVERYLLSHSPKGDHNDAYSQKVNNVLKKYNERNNPVYGVSLVGRENLVEYFRTVDVDEILRRFTNNQEGLRKYLNVYAENVMRLVMANNKMYIENAKLATEIREHVIDENLLSKIQKFENDNQLLKMKLDETKEKIKCYEKTIGGLNELLRKNTIKMMYGCDLARMEHEYDADAEEVAAELLELQKEAIEMNLFSETFCKPTLGIIDGGRK